MVRRTFQPEGKVCAKTFWQKELIIVNTFLAALSNKVGARDTIENSDGT